MTYIYELFDLEDLHRALEDGFVRRQYHPTEPLVIYNYTEKCAFANEWNAVTRTCRGLIVHSGNGRVVARPLPKFFNYGQTGEDPFDLDEPVRVFDKMDGSLGILYPTSQGMAVATRGSFTSEQALKATEILHEKYPEWAQITYDWFRSNFDANWYEVNYTDLVEIVYPENRIVVDYAGMEDLVYLGQVQISTGEFTAHHLSWTGPVSEEFTSLHTLQEVLESEPRPGKEGYVVWSADMSRCVKIKQQDYIELHRLVTGLNARRVYQAMRGDQGLVQIASPLPDEFHDFVRDVYYQLIDDVLDLIDVVYDEYNRARDVLEGRDIQESDKDFRKEFALEVKDFEYKGLVFKVLDNKSIHDDAWRMVEPSADWTPATHDKFRRTLED
jgi:RNA ligase